jgi:hypothetical protein
MAYLKGLASSLAKRVIPDVGNKIFGDELNTYKEIKDKVFTSREILRETQSNIKTTVQSFEGFSKVGRKLGRQVRTGKFGLTQDERDDIDMKAMGFDFDMDSLGDSLDQALEKDGNENSSGSSKPSSKNIIIPIMGKSRGKSGGLDAGSALISERLAYITGIQAQIGQTQITLLQGIGAQLAGIGNFLGEQTVSHYQGTLEYQKLMSDNLSLSREVNDLMKEKLMAEKKAAEKKMATGSGVGWEGFDPTKIAKDINEGPLGMLFGEMSPLRGFFQQVSVDPLGTLMALGLAHGASSLFGGSIEKAKGAFKTAGVRVQSTLEKWAATYDDSFTGMFKSWIGDTLRTKRESATVAKLGAYDKGAAQFDGTTRKAIVDVIPMYLAKILKAISGNSTHEVYDYNKGAFITSKSGAEKHVKNVKELRRGEFLGGLSNELTGLRADPSVSKSDFGKIRASMIRSASSLNSHEIKLDQVKMRDARLQETYDKYIKGLDEKSKASLYHSFQSHKYDVAAKLKDYQNSMYDDNKGVETSAILEGINPRILNYDSVEKANKRNKLDENERKKLKDRIKESFNKKINSIKNRRRGGGNPPPSGGPGNSDDSGDSGDDSAGDSWFKRWLGKLSNGKSFSLNSFAEGLVGTLTIGMNKLSKSFNRNILFPMKRALLGKDTDTRTIVRTPFIAAVGTKFDKTVLFPLKKALLGGNEKQAERMNIFGAIQKSFDRNIVFPFKRTLLGKDTDVRTILKTSFIKSLGIRIDKSVLLPFKTMLLGGNKVKAEKVTFVTALKDTFKKNVVLPMKLALLGKDTNLKTLLKTPFTKAIGQRFEQSILNPLKGLLLGKHSTTNGGSVDPTKTGFFKALGLSFDRNISRPIKTMLFGQGNRNKSFFKNIGETLSPFFNKLLFGSEKAEKAGFMANLKGFSENIFKGFSDRFIKPIKDAFGDFFGKTMQDFISTLRDSAKDFLASLNIDIGKGFKEGAKGFFKTVFGDETVKILRDNIVTPLNDVTKKLTSSIGMIAKLLLRVPANFIKGITNTLKLNRVKAGKGNYSDEEKARLLDMEKKGSLFNFLDTGNEESNKKISSLKNKVTGFLNRGKKATDGSPTSSTNVGTLDTNSTSSNTEGKTGSITDKAKNLFNRKNKNGDSSANPNTDANGNIISASSTNSKKGTKTGFIDGLKNRISGKDSSDSDVNKSDETKKSRFSIIERLPNRENIGSLFGRNKDKNSENSVHDSARPKIGTLTGIPVGGAAKLGGIVGHLNAPKLASRVDNISKMSELTSASSAATAKSNMDILNFLKHHLGNTTQKLTKIVNAVAKGKAVSKIASDDKESVSFFRNPLKWAMKTSMKILGFPLSMMKGMFSVGSKMIKGLMEVPKKIIGITVDLGAKLASMTLNVATSLTKGIFKAVDFIAQGIGKTIETIGKAINSIVSSITSLIATSIDIAAKAAASLARGVLNATKAIGKGLLPAFEGLTAMVGRLGKGLFELGTLVIDGFVKSIKGTMKLAGRIASGLMGKVFGRDRKLSASFSSITNFKDLILATKKRPLHVYIEDGKVATYEYKPPVSTFFKDKVEDRSLLNSKKDKAKEKDSTSIFGKIAGALGSLFSGGLLAKSLGALTGFLKGGGILSKILLAITFMGKGLMSLIGTIAKNVATLVFGKKAGDLLDNIPGRRSKGKLGKIAKSENIVDRYTAAKAEKQAIKDRATKAADKLANARNVIAEKQTSAKASGNKIAEKLANARKAMAEGGSVTRTGAGAAEGAANAAKSGGSMFSRVVNGAKGFFTKAGERLATGGGLGGAMKGFGGRLLKGGWKGFGISAIGGGLADTFFDKGTAGNDVLGTGASYAGWGATIGSVIPGVGTAVGAIIGGLVGAVKGAIPHLIEAFKKPIIGMTDYFAEIPDRISQYAQELPNKIAGLVGQIPDMINGWFLGDAEETPKIDEKTGQVIQKKPGIMGSLFSSIGSAVMSVAKALPRIAATLVEGLVKGILTTVVSLMGNVVNSAMNFVGGLGVDIKMMAARAIVAIKNKTFLLSDEEAAQQYKELDKQAEEEKAAIVSSSNTMDFVNGLTKSIASFSVADKIPTGIESSSVMQEKLNYDKSMKDADGDKAKAKEAFIKSYTADGKDAKSGEDAWAYQERAQNIRNGTDDGVSTPEYKGFQGSVSEAISKAANEEGVPVGLMTTMAKIESNGNPKATSPGNGTFKGLYQMGPDAWKENSPNINGDIFDPYLNAVAAARFIKKNINYMQSKGVPIDNTSVYLAHQQGPGGIVKIFNAAKNGTPLDQTTIRNMANNRPQDGNKAATTDPNEFLRRWAVAVKMKGGGDSDDLTGTLPAFNANSGISQGTASAISGINNATTEANGSSGFDPSALLMGMSKGLNPNLVSSTAEVETGNGMPTVGSNPNRPTAQVAMKSSMNSMPTTGNGSVTAGATTATATANPSLTSQEVVKAQAVNNAIVTADPVKYSQIKDNINNADTNSSLARLIEKTNEILSGIKIDTGVVAENTKHDETTESIRYSNQSPRSNTYSNQDERVGSGRRFFEEGLGDLYPGEGARRIAQGGTN